MKRRSVVATMLAAAMALSLTACGSKSADTAQTTAAAGTDTTAAADANTTSDWPKQLLPLKNRQVFPALCRMLQEQMAGWHGHSCFIPNRMVIRSLL